jgi:hypothetical protein
MWEAYYYYCGVRTLILIFSSLSVNLVSFPFAFITPISLSCAELGHLCDDGDIGRFRDCIDAPQLEESA